MTSEAPLFTQAADSVPADTVPPVASPPKAGPAEADSAAAKPAVPLRSAGVQFGPTPSLPGSRLKKDRR